MADKDFTIDINLDSNAKSSAQDLTQVVSAIDKVTEAQNRHNRRANKNAQNQIKVNREILDTLKRIRDLNVRTAATQLKNQRTAEKIDKDNLGREKQHIANNNVLLRQVAKLALIRLPIQAAGAILNINRQYAALNTSAIASGATPEQIKRMKFLTQGYGGTDQTAAAFYRNMNMIGKQFYVDRNLPIHQLLSRLPKLQPIFLKNGRWEKDADKIFAGLREIFPKLDQFQKMAVAEAIGLDDSLFAVLSLPKEKFDELAKKAKNMPMPDTSNANNVKNIEESAKEGTEWFLNMITPDWLKAGFSFVSGVNKGTRGLLSTAALVTGTAYVSSSVTARSIARALAKAAPPAAKATVAAAPAAEAASAVAKTSKLARFASGFLGFVSKLATVATWGEVFLNPMTAGGGEDEALFNPGAFVNRERRPTAGESLKKSIKAVFDLLKKVNTVDSELVKGVEDQPIPMFRTPVFIPLAGTPMSPSPTALYVDGVTINVSGVDGDPQAIGEAAGKSLLEFIDREFALRERG